MHTQVFVYDTPNSIAVVLPDGIKAFVAQFTVDNLIFEMECLAALTTAFVMYPNQIQIFSDSQAVEYI